MKILTEYLTFHTKTHRAYVHITPQVEEIHITWRGDQNHSPLRLNPAYATGPTEELPNS
jgi:hypothetical protein